MYLFCKLFAGTSCFHESCWLNTCCVESCLEFFLRTLQLTIIAELRRPHNYRNRITCMHRKRNPCNSFFMVKMDRGRLCPTTTSRNTAALLGLIPQFCSLGLQRVSLILNILAMVNWHLSKQGIGWPVSSVLIAGSSLELIELLCFSEVNRRPSTGFPLNRGLMSY